MSLHVPFGDLSRQYQAQHEALEAAALRVMRGGWYVLGPEVRGFEAEFAAYVGVRHCISVANGTDALNLALRALDLPPGSEVITVANAASYEPIAIREAGLVPRFADVEEQSHTLSPASLTAAITDRTRAVMPVHLYGRPAAMDQIMAIADAHRLLVIEDCAQSHGARAEDRMTGAIGTLGCFSFYPTKNLGALGDGGAIVTDDEQLAERVRQLRTYGWDRKYHNAVPHGTNSRLDELQAAILRVRLPELNRWNALRRERAAWYHELLADVDGVELPALSDAHVFHLFVIRVFGGRRNAVQQALHERGVGTDIHYPIPAHLQPAFDDLGYDSGELPVTERLAESVLSLPCYPELTRADVEYVAAAVRAVVQ